MRCGEQFNFLNTKDMYYSEVILQLAYHISDKLIKFIKPTVEVRGKENRVPPSLLRRRAWQLWTVVAVTLFIPFDQYFYFWE